MQMLCSSCTGKGEITNWKVVNIKDNMGTVVKEEAVCEVCNGKGYIEYATFTPEEAKAILKYCGLSTES